MTAIIFDTETNRLHGDIIQAAYINIEIEEGVVTNDGSFLLQNYQPSETIDFEAMAIHNIIPDDLKGYPYFTECRIPAVKYVIGHNIDYDMDALFKAGQNTVDISRICTLAIMRYLYPQLNSYKLGVLCYQFSENLHQTQELLRHAHNALTDCYATQLLIEHIVEIQGIQTMEELYQLSEKARFPTHFYWGRFKGQRISDVDTHDLFWVLQREANHYVLSAIESELETRESDYDDELPL